MHDKHDIMNRNCTVAEMQPEISVGAQSAVGMSNQVSHHTVSGKKWRVFVQRWPATGIGVHDEVFSRIYSEWTREDELRQGWKENDLVRYAILYLTICCSAKSPNIFCNQETLVLVNVVNVTTC